MSKKFKLKFTKFFKMTTHSTPLVSIITPTYNHQDYIGSCIESVLKQTYQSWELIIIDDGSADGTAKTIDGFKDPRIRYVHQQNQGIKVLAHTYNRALGLCHGEFVAILEGDDLWPAEKLSILVPAFNDQEVVLAYGAVADIAANGEWRGRLSRSVRTRMQLPNAVLTNDPPGETTRYLLRADGVDLVPPSTVIIRRSTLTAIGGFQYVPNLWVTDFPTFAALSLRGKFYYTREVVGCRRRHLASTTYNNLSHIVTQAGRYATQFLDEHPSLINPAQRAAIKATWDSPRPPLEFTAGRLKLLNRDWKGARSHFKRALKPLIPHVFFAAVVGWMLSWIHCDLEKLLASRGFATLKDAKPTRPSAYVYSNSLERH